MNGSLQPTCFDSKGIIIVVVVWFLFVVLLLFVLFYVVFMCKCVLPPGDNPIEVNKYIISSGSPYKTFKTHHFYKFLHYTLVRYHGPGSVVGIATGYGLDGPGIESWWGRNFPHLSRPALGPTQPPAQ
jgi:hypothetical protein